MKWIHQNETKLMELARETYPDLCCSWDEMPNNEREKFLAEYERRLKLTARSAEPEAK